ncbi:MAG: septal ring lytic transglycosylase RlpA family protein [Candidatus Aminicenantes bacterium]|nr:septal ring lytic transglycosylase RlpA family protein [Candidatus Aminicenantes bacterium]
MKQKKEMLLKLRKHFYFSRVLFAFSIIILVFSQSCQSTSPALAPPVGYIETGIASWYGPGFHGQKTSSSEVFNMHELTAAHRTLPFGTLVLVTNLENGRSVTVRINDRGPFVKGRVIDLSYAAAKMLDLVGSGTARVRLEVIDHVPLERGEYLVQLGSFTRMEYARQLYQTLKKDFPGIFIYPFQFNKKIYYRVRIRATNEKEARKLADKLSRLGYPVLLLFD